MRGFSITAIAVLAISRFLSGQAASGVGSFHPAGSIDIPRSGHTATTLMDGRVLIAGGSTDAPRHANLKSAILYDPKSARFLPTGDLVTPREDHTATLLRD